jgi:hypothetical protein
MNDMVNGSNQNFDATPVSNSSATSAPPPATQTPTEERLFKQSEVNDIVKRVKHETTESYKRMANEQPHYLQQKIGDTTPQQVDRGSYQETSNLQLDQVKRMIAEETQRLGNEERQRAQRMAQEQESQRIATEFLGKLNTGKEKYQDFDNVMAGIDLPSYSNAVWIANMVDNTSDVWYHLANDPIKLESINSMASRSPQAALNAVRRLSQSIKDNDTAKNTKLPNEPLRQLRPSNTGTDNGDWSVAAARAKYKG